MTGILDVVDINAGNPRWVGQSGRGRRTLTWTVPVESGMLCRNECTAVNVIVEELSLWAGEPLRVLSRRTTPGQVGWQPFTDAATKTIATEIRQAIQRTGFTGLWDSRVADQLAAENTQKDVDAATDFLEWTRMLAELKAMISVGLAEFRPTPKQIVHRGDYTLGKHDRAEATAEIVAGTEIVGWFTVDGEIIPNWVPSTGTKGPL